MGNIVIANMQATLTLNDKDFKDRVADAHKDIDRLEDRSKSLPGAQASNVGSHDEDAARQQASIDRAANLSAQVEGVQKVAAASETAASIEEAANRRRRAAFDAMSQAQLEGLTKVTAAADVLNSKLDEAARKQEQIGSSPLPVRRDTATGPGAEPDTQQEAQGQGAQPSDTQPQMTHQGAVVPPQAQPSTPALPPPAPPLLLRPAQEPPYTGLATEGVTGRSPVERPHYVPSPERVNRARQAVLQRPMGGTDTMPGVVGLLDIEEQAETLARQPLVFPVQPPPKAIDPELALQQARQERERIKYAALRAQQAGAVEAEPAQAPAPVAFDIPAEVQRGTALAPAPARALAPEPEPALVPAGGGGGKPPQAPPVRVATQDRQPTEGGYGLSDEQREHIRGIVEASAQDEEAFYSQVEGYVNSQSGRANLLMAVQYADQYRKEYKKQPRKAAAPEPAAIAQAATQVVEPPEPAAPAPAAPAVAAVPEQVAPAAMNQEQVAEYWARFHPGMPMPGAAPSAPAVPGGPTITTDRDAINRAALMVGVTDPNRLASKTSEPVMAPPSFSTPAEPLPSPDYYAHKVDEAVGDIGGERIATQLAADRGIMVAMGAAGARRPAAAPPAPPRPPRPPQEPPDEPPQYPPPEGHELPAEEVEEPQHGDSPDDGRFAHARQSPFFPWFHPPHRGRQESLAYQRYQAIESPQLGPVVRFAEGAGIPGAATGLAALAGPELAAAGAALAFGIALKEATDAALALSKSQFILDEQLRTSASGRALAEGGFTERQAHALEPVGVSARQETALLGEITRYTRDPGEIERVQREALDFARANGVALQQAQQMFIQASQGNAGAFHEFIPQIRQGDTFAYVEQQVRERYGGAADRFMNTPEGRITKLQTDWDTMLEHVGQRTLPIVDSIVSGADKLIPVADGLGRTLGFVITSVTDLGKVLLTPLELLGRVIPNMDNLWDTIGKGMDDITAKANHFLDFTQHAIAPSRFEEVTGLSQDASGQYGVRLENGVPLHGPGSIPAPGPFDLTTPNPNVPDREILGLRAGPQFGPSLPMAGIELAIRQLMGQGPGAQAEPPATPATRQYDDMIRQLAAANPNLRRPIGEAPTPGERGLGQMSAEEAMRASFPTQQSLGEFQQRTKGFDQGTLQLTGPYAVGGGGSGPGSVPGIQSDKTLGDTLANNATAQISAMRQIEEEVSSSESAITGVQNVFAKLTTFHVDWAQVAPNLDNLRSGIIELQKFWVDVAHSKDSAITQKVYQETQTWIDMVNASAEMMMNVGKAFEQVYTSSSLMPTDEQIRNVVYKASHMFEQVDAIAQAYMRPGGKDQGINQASLQLANVEMWTKGIDGVLNMVTNTTTAMERIYTVPLPDEGRIKEVAGRIVSTIKLTSQAIEEAFMGGSRAPGFIGPVKPMIDPGLATGAAISDNVQKLIELENAGTAGLRQMNNLYVPTEDEVKTAVTRVVSIGRMMTTEIQRQIAEASTPTTDLAEGFSGRTRQVSEAIDPVLKAAGERAENLNKLMAVADSGVGVISGMKNLYVPTDDEMEDIVTGIFGVLDRAMEHLKPQDPNLQARVKAWGDALGPIAGVMNEMVGTLKGMTNLYVPTDDEISRVVEGTFLTIDKALVHLPVWDSQKAAQVKERAEALGSVASMMGAGVADLRAMLNLYVPTPQEIGRVVSGVFGVVDGALANLPAWNSEQATQVKERADALGSVASFMGAGVSDLRGMTNLYVPTPQEIGRIVRGVFNSVDDALADMPAWNPQQATQVQQRAEALSATIGFVSGGVGAIAGMRNLYVPSDADIRRVIHGTFSLADDALADLPPYNPQQAAQVKERADALNAVMSMVSTSIGALHDMRNLVEPSQGQMRGFKEHFDSLRTMFSDVDQSLDPQQASRIKDFGDSMNAEFGGIQAIAGGLQAIRDVRLPSQSEMLDFKRTLEGATQSLMPDILGTSQPAADRARDWGDGMAATYGALSTGVDWLAKMHDLFLPADGMIDAVVMEEKRVSDKFIDAAQRLSPEQTKAAEEYGKALSSGFDAVSKGADVLKAAMLTPPISDDMIDSYFDMLDRVTEDFSARSGVWVKKQQFENSKFSVELSAELDAMIKTADLFSKFPAFRIDYTGQINMIFTNLDHMVDEFAEGSKRWAGKTDERTHQIAATIGDEMGALSKALDPLIHLPEIGMVQPGLVTAAFRNVQREIQEFEGLMDMPELQGENLAKLNQFAGSVNNIFGAIKSASDTVMGLNASQLASTYGGDLMTVKSASQGAIDPVTMQAFDAGPVGGIGGGDFTSGLEQFFMKQVPRYADEWEAQMQRITDSAGKMADGVAGDFRDVARQMGMPAVDVRAGVRGTAPDVSVPTVAHTGTDTPTLHTDTNRGTGGSGDSYNNCLFIAGVQVAKGQTVQDIVHMLAEEATRVNGGVPVNDPAHSR